VRRLARAIPLDADDRPVAAMLLLPFFLLAFTIAANQALKSNAAGHYLATRFPSAPSLMRRDPVSRARTELPVAIPLPASTTTIPTVAAAIPATTTPVEMPVAKEIRSTVQVGLPAVAMPASAPPDTAGIAAGEIEPAIAADGIGSVDLRAAPAGEILVSLAPTMIPPAGAPPALAAAPWPLVPDEDAPVCRPKAKPAAMPVASLHQRWPADERGWADLGQRLAEAARSQLGTLVIYNDSYQRIAYPMGDVPALFGVCTDVVIRAYRALGIDLQAEVQRARLGSGDASIDHRRTETLRRLFGRYGETLPVSSFADDYQPGDIVTYHRPQNRRSRSHIAIVADVVGPSGRPMIVHNRGWGPQLEDALFADPITGHYRYSGIRPSARSRPGIAADRGNASHVAQIRSVPARPVLDAAFKPDQPVR